MVGRHPLHKRVLSRIGFYGGVLVYLLVLQAAEREMPRGDFTSIRPAASSVR